MRQDRVESEF